jgi:hypothetical protein
MRNSQKGLKYNNDYMSMIMSVSENEVTPFLTFVGNDMITDKDLKDINIDIDTYDLTVDQRIWALKKIWHFFDYFEGPDFIFTRFFKGGFMNCVLYYPQTKQAKWFKNWTDDVVYVPSQKPSSNGSNHFLFADRKGIYTSIHLGGIGDFINDRDNDKLSPSLMNNPKIYEINEDSNPIVFYYEFKD